jgi:hypothetical protein
MENLLTKEPFCPKEFFELKNEFKVSSADGVRVFFEGPLHLCNEL